MLEELNIPYKIEYHSLTEIKQEPFTKLNPNGRVPSMCAPLEFS